jgi:hypothetical protein
MLSLHELNVYDEEVIEFMTNVHLDDEKSTNRAKTNFQTHDQRD